MMARYVTFPDPLLAADGVLLRAWMPPEGRRDSVMFSLLATDLAG